jgi:hypothetical protein
MLRLLVGSGAVADQDCLITCSEDVCVCVCVSVCVCVCVCGIWYQDSLITCSEDGIVRVISVLVFLSPLHTHRQTQACLIYQADTIVSCRVEGLGFRV